MISLYEYLGVPLPFVVTVLTIAFILMLVPWVPGADFGIFKVPELTASQRKRLRRWGPVGFVVFLVGFVGPIVPKEWRAVEGEGGDQSVIELLAHDICAAARIPRFYETSKAKTYKDDDCIRRLVEDEGNSVEAENVQWHVSLFHEKALVIHSLSGMRAYGCKEIVQRDFDRFRSVRYDEVSDEIILLRIEGERANAVTTHFERVLGKTSDERLNGDALGNIDVFIDWQFRRDKGVWRIWSMVPCFRPKDLGGDQARQ